jgi:hypothetical protein
MPALTVKALAKSFAGLLRPDTDFVASLNMVMPRIYAMGFWRDLVAEHHISTTNEYVSLPDGSESVLGAMVGNIPSEIEARWHDYRISGYITGGAAPIYGLVDDGWHPTLEDLNGDEDNTYGIRLEPVGPAAELPVEGQVVVMGVDVEGNAVEWVHDFNGGTFAESNVFNFVNVTSISFSDLPQFVEVIAVHLDGDEVTLAKIRDEGFARYRRYRFANPSGERQSVRVLVKRSWVPVLCGEDIVHLGNLNAIKQGLLGMTAEDNADLERAQYHWAVCRQLLEDEMDAARGAAKPRLRIQPFGVGAGHRTPNIL